MFNIATELTSGDVALIWVVFFGAVTLIILAVIIACYRAVRGDQRIQEKQAELKLKQEERKELEARNRRAELELQSYNPQRIDE